MKIYLLTSNLESIQYEVFDSAVVIAKSESDARKIHPDRSIKNWDGEKTKSWPESESITVECLGQAKAGADRGVVLASFIA